MVVVVSSSAMSDTSRLSAVVAVHIVHEPTQSGGRRAGEG